MFRLLPVSRSTRAARMWTCTPPSGSSCLHGCPGVAVGVQARPGGLLELIEDG